MSLFHGTDADIPTGEWVLPGRRMGRRNWQDAPGIDHTRGEHAFATEDREGAAWEFAAVASDNHGGRARVYEVEPHPSMDPGRYNSVHPEFTEADRAAGDDQGEWLAPGFKVKGRIDIKPGHQGTLPLNWRQFAPKLARVSTVLTDVNHPDPEEVAFGHRGGRMRLEPDAVVPALMHQELRGQQKLPL